MDSPHCVPESPSPVVLRPAGIQLSDFLFTAAEMTEAVTNTATRPLPRFSGINHQHRTRSIAAVTASTSADRTNPLLSVFDVPVADAPVAGPTTRSRKRSHSSARERSPETTDVSSTVSAPSRKRKAPSAAPKGSRSKAPRSTSNRKKPPPRANLKEASPVASADGDDDAADKKPAAIVENCCICMCDVEPNDIAMINSCDHRFCFGCIEKWSERENKCPLCKTRFTKIDRVQKKRKKGTKNSKRVKQRDQRSDLAPGAALEGLIANLNRNSGSLARIIFGGFEFGHMSGPGATGPRPFPATRTPNGAAAEFVDEESDDDDSPMAAFMRALHGTSGANGVRMSTTVMQPMTLTAHFTTTTRSFARNLHDSTAGNGADNPLEIDDDSVEEVIEID